MSTQETPFSYWWRLPFQQILFACSAQLVPKVRKYIQEDYEITDHDLQIIPLDLRDPHSYNAYPYHQFIIAGEKWAINRFVQDFNAKNGGNF